MDEMKCFGGLVNNQKMKIYYPSNWFYNAGVIGLCLLLSNPNLSIEPSFDEAGGVSIDIEKIKDKKKDLFNEWKKVSEDKGYSYGGKGGYYANQTDKSIDRNIDHLIEGDKKVGKRETVFICPFCLKSFPKSDAVYLKTSFSNILFPARTMPNSFWGLNEDKGLFCCPSCSFILMCHHIALTKLADGSEIFINAPSFKLMWHLNKYVKEIFEREKIQAVRQLLGMSLIEMALKLNLQLGKWTMMNIEVVIKRESEIDFFSLPFETVTMLLDRDIASQLRNIGEVSILNLFLEGKYREILELGERILEIALKSDRGKQDDHFINHYIKLGKNKEKGKKNKNLIVFTQNLFKLYALIEEKTKGGLVV